jgi:glycosyltransferase involved in cell wall biosynthesis/SAM-dependent methyltransferase
VRVAYVSPLPPQRTGVADYSALLLPALRRKLDVTVVGRATRRPGGGADVVVYHVGNEPEAHGWILQRLRRRPGVVVLHDFVLHHLVAGLTLGRGDAAGYVAALERDAGPVGAMLAHGVIDGLVPPLWEASPARFPLVREALDHASGVIVHSAYVERRVRATGYERPVWRIPHPAWPAPSVERRRELLPGRSPIVGCVGNLDANKRIPELLAAFARVLEAHPHAGLVLGGATAADLELTDRLRAAGLTPGEDVLVTGYVDERALWSVMDGCDVCVSLRSPTMGETSGTAIRALSLGKPLVVSDVGWFAELPAAVAAKVAVDEWEVELLAAVLIRLVEDEALRTAMGGAALAYVRAHHDVDEVAERYTAALEEAAGGSAVRDAVLRDVARAAGAVGLTSGDRTLSLVANRFLEAGLGSTAVPEPAPTAVAARVPGSPAGSPNGARTASKAPPDLGRLFPPPPRAFGDDYGRRQAELVAFVLGRPDLVARFRAGEELLAGLGSGFDERVVEYAWFLAQDPGGRTLDAGSTLNHAHVLDHVLPRVTTLHVVTLVPEPVSFPERGVRYTYADLRELPYPDASFDTVVSLSTLEHVGMDTTPYGVESSLAADARGELGRAVRELTRVVRPGGKLLVTVPYGRREDHGWFRQFEAADVDDLIAMADAKTGSVDIFRYTAEGWQRSSPEAAAAERYHDHRTNPETPADRAAAARAVACIRLDY